jgi:hypothetical protein
MSSKPDIDGIYVIIFSSIYNILVLSIYKDDHFGMSKLPFFPTFKNVDLDDLYILQEITSPFAPYSDFNFVSLFTWNINKTASYSILNNHLIIRLVDYTDSSKNIFSVFGLGDDIIPSLRELFNHPEINSLSLVPHITISDIKKYDTHGSYLVTPDRDNFDYVYELPKLVSMESSEYRKLRRSISNFHTKNNLSVEVKQIELNNQLSLDSILSLTKKWRDIRGRSYREASLEYFAIRRALRHAAHIPISIFTAQSEGEIVAFAIIEKQGSHAILHFEKARTEYIGLASYFKTELAKILVDEGVSHLNYEQDLGITGLREYKMSLNPATYLKKYTVTKQT